jgi:multiple sugar transport system substrate-binding protein
MKQFSVFQIVLTGAFVLFAAVGVFFFAGFGGFTDSDNQLGEVVIWGTIDERIMQDVIARVATEREGFGGVRYVEKDERTFESELVNALAAGVGPDLFLLSQDAILSHEDKVAVVPFESYSERTFKDTFIEEGELYLRPDGIIGLPFTVDPMVMYWNRDIFTDASIANPPRYWDELFELAPRVTQRDRASNIVRSAVSFGEFRNVSHAKDILAMLFMQAENPIVVREVDGMITSVLRENRGFTTNPAEAALRFYTEFSNPIKSVYSWNRALPEARQSFLAGDLAVYFGFASEYEALRQANPNLNFDLALVPQSRDAATRTTFGEMHAFAIPRGAGNASASFTVAAVLTTAGPIADVAWFLDLPPVRRDLLRDRPSDAVRSVLYESALMSRAWLDPNPQESDAIFQEMVESTVSGRARLGEAVSTASQQLQNAISN